MSSVVQRFSVPFEYPVCFTSNIFSPTNRTLFDAISRREPNRTHRVYVVMDRGVITARPGLVEELKQYVNYYSPSLVLMDEPVAIDGGEPVKNNPALILNLQARLNALGADRQSFVLVVGGGAVLDMAGYAASTLHRGLRVVRVPTTVLSQCDSGVGVKNGINAYGKKNFFGTFAPPFAVINDHDFIDTLSTRDKIAGMAEAVKVALIRDVDFFCWLENHVCNLAACNPDALRSLIWRSAKLHLDHIAGSNDPFEFGPSRPLDFGHWAAHKLESLTQHRLRHGEAVAIGIALDSLYSHAIGLLSSPSLNRILALLEQLGFRLVDRSLYAANAGRRRLVLEGLREFSEHLGGDLSITLLQDIGRSIEVSEMRTDVILACIDRLAGQDAALCA